MNILQVHKYYWHRDGASNYMLYLSELLQKASNTVIPFSMENENNLDSDFSSFFVSEMKLDDPKKIGFLKKIKYTARMFYSLEARKKMKELLSREKIDIAHLHNIYHHISPSILSQLKKKKIPIVMTLHDYKLICPNYTMFHHGKVHEEDCRGWYCSCIKNKCHKDSYLQSFILAKEMFFHHKIMRYYERYVDKFIAPSQFIMDKCIEFGWPKEKFIHIPHPIDLKNFSISKKDAGYVAYAGRLSGEKGLEVLLDAAAKTSEIPYKIIGTGPEEERLKQKTKNLQLKNVEFTGFQTAKKLQELLQGARLFVVPSIWYENYPLSILEPKAMAKIVIGSKIGGIPELLPAELLSPPGDSRSLSNEIEKWYNATSQKRESLGKKLHDEVENINNPEKHKKAIIDLYSSLL